MKTIWNYLYILFSQDYTIDNGVRDNNTGTQNILQTLHKATVRYDEQIRNRKGRGDDTEKFNNVFSTIQGKQF